MFAKGQRGSWPPSWSTAASSDAARPAANSGVVSDIQGMVVRNTSQSLMSEKKGKAPALCSAPSKPRYVPSASLYVVGAAYVWYSAV
jgi:hypothetical protein